MTQTIITPSENHIYELFFDEQNPKVPLRRFIRYDASFKAFVDVTSNIPFAGAKRELANSVYRQRWNERVCALLREEALLGHVYTLTSFARAFRYHPTIGISTIGIKLQSLATIHKIKFFNNAAHYGLPQPHSPYGYICVKDMFLKQKGDNKSKLIVPTHERALSDQLVPVQNLKIWQ